ncbi:MAG: hypothetical protein M1839_004588 [Geoglossum umbratile]|nr:MAG: hypothetical protein M1839_004588 [Geoglossum umbratile]
MFIGTLSLLGASAAIALAASVNKITCNGQDFKYKELAGYGAVPSDSRDKFGDTLSIGSSLALDRSSWSKKHGTYEGIVWGLPDRGWNTQGTVNAQARVHKYKFTFTPDPNATVAKPSPPNLLFEYVDTILFTGPDGKPTTGIDPTTTKKYPGFPEMPFATWPGDGFGFPGTGGEGVPIDCEGLVLGKDGSFWISDEYGPFIYQFNKGGRMVKAIRPPEAAVPRRNGSVSFSAASPPIFNDKLSPIPPDPQSGRSNNQGLEGLTSTGDGKFLYALMQSGLNQEGGPSKQTNQLSRLIKYDIRDGNPKYVAEYVVRLPTWTDPTVSDPVKAIKTAAQSEIHYVGKNQFLILTRDSGFGHGQKAANSQSNFRHVDIIDISSATNVKSPSNDAPTGAIASSSGVLKPGIVTAKYCTFLDFNINTQLNRFKSSEGIAIHNGGAQDSGLLNEKWESLGLLPVDGKDGDDGRFYLFSFSDNDFITQNGFANFGEFTFKDSSGFNLDSQALVFKVRLPKGDKPWDDDDREGDDRYD